MKNKKLNYIIIILVLLIVGLSFYLLSSPKKITFTIKEEKIILNVGDKTKVNYEISDSSIKINWNSINPSIASIDNDANITANSYGVTVINGIINDNNIEKSVTCIVVVKSTNTGIILDDISLPNGEILLSVSDVYSIPITYIPNDAYVEKINYYPEDNSIIKVDNGLITALKPGYTTLTIVANNSIYKELRVNVTENKISSNIITPINEININHEETIYTNDTKKITYSIEPSNGTIFDIKWTNYDTNIISIDDNGIIKGLKSGETTIHLTINNRIKDSIYVIVKPKIDSISLDYNPKSILKVGDSFNLEPTISPKNSPAKIVYQSNNPSALSVNQNGTVTALGPGTSSITIKSDDGSVSKVISFTIVNAKGVMNTDKTIWAFSKDTDTTPKRADESFFNELAKKGKGTVSNGVYIYQKYSYDIKSSILTIDNKNKIAVRLYYPPNRDLSTLNTFTFIGGVGETNFGGSASQFDNDPSQMKTSGIIIYIVESNKAKVYGANVAEATNFVNQIVNQNKNARNAIGGYSNGGPPTGDAIQNGHYDKGVYIDTSFYWVNNRPNAKNLEYVIYSPQGDSWRGTDSFIGELYNFGVKNVTVVSNNQSIVNRFQDKYLVINPGKSMKNGHTSENLVLSHLFSYACD